VSLQPLRVAAVQAVAVAGEVETNVATAVAWVRKGAEAGASLVVLPELFVPGYDPETLTARPGECDVTPEDPRLEPLRAAALAGGVTVLVGASVRQPDGRRTLSMLAVDASGGCTVPYSKQHLWDAERGIFEPGVEGASLRLGEWPVGLGICYDGCFPEHARAAADDGALVYVCPSAYVVGSEHRRDLYYAARAIDNGFYVVFAGLVGDCGSLSFSGGTAIYDPQGRPVARVTASREDDRRAVVGGGPSSQKPVEGMAVADVEGMAVADLDPAVIAEARRINPYDRDRPDSLGARHWLTLPL
jgi:predicted amidohydrolase